MKILLSTVAALSLLGGSAAMAQSYDHDQHSYQQGAADQRASDQRDADQRADQRAADRQEQRNYDRRAEDRRLDDRRADEGRRDEGYRHEQGYRHDHGHHYGQMRQWSRGDRLPPQYFNNRGYYVDYRAHHLRHPPRGYRWVQVDNNYMLVAAASGLIAQIIGQR